MGRLNESKRVVRFRHHRNSIVTVWRVACRFPLWSLVPRQSCELLRNPVMHLSPDDVTGAHIAQLKIPLLP